MAKSLRSDAHLTFVGVLRAARLDRGLTQQALADRLGRPQSYIAKIEGHERRLDVIEFLEIARALGISPVDLLDPVQAEMRRSRD